MSEKTPKDWKKFKEEHSLPDDLNLDIAQDVTEEEHADAEGAQGGASALDHPSYQSLEEKLTQAEQKVHEHWEKLVRATAEVDNIRRRTERDVQNAHRFALEKFVNTLLPVADSLEHAIVLAKQKDDAILHEGLELTMKLLKSVFDQANVKPVDPQGELFDPQTHEAMSIQETIDYPPNTVLTVFQKGYLLNERLIRPARVIVSK